MESTSTHNSPFYFVRMSMEDTGVYYPSLSISISVLSQSLPLYLSLYLHLWLSLTLVRHQIDGGGNSFHYGDTPRGKSTGVNFD